MYIVYRYVCMYVCTHTLLANTNTTIIILLLILLSSISISISILATS